ncbi:epoxide hydrolase [Mesorhizobium sp. M1169]
MAMHSFHIHIPDEQIEYLQRRIQSTRWPSSIFAYGWDDGTDVDFLRKLSRYWEYDFRWRDHEKRLNLLPQFRVTIDGCDIHFVHQKGKGSAPLPLILTHGWPGSFAEFEHVIPLLTDPAKYGGDAEDAFDVVAPSLPGFGFSSPPHQAGVSSKRVAKLWRGLMRELRYDRFAAQGGDIGAGVSTWLARLYPDDLIGLHLNYIPGSFRPTLGRDDPPVTPEEKAFLDSAANFAATEGAYAFLQGTKPQTLAFALTDSPIGLAAWIAEKFRSWSDCEGELERAIPLDTLLTDISLYWFGNTIEASLRIYKENRLCPLIFGPRERITPPLGVAVFPRELPMPPRSWVERVFRVERWTDMPKGGHFAAIEQPELLVEDIRAFFRPLRLRPAK